MGTYRGDRRAVAICFTIGIVGIVGALIWFDILAVGSSSSAASLFGSGLTSGIITLVTIALSINQLIISRVFGTINSLTGRLDSARGFREDVTNLAGKSSGPNDPAAFLSMVARTLNDRVSTLHAMSESGDWVPPRKVMSGLRDIGEYGKNIDSHLQDNTQVDHVLYVILGSEYAINMTAVRHMQNEYAESLSVDVQEEFQAIEKLLESIAIIRQFNKTVILQRDLAQLSRMLVYSGLIAVTMAISLTLIYRSNSVTVPASTLPIVISLGIGVIITPLTLFAAYILRTATIARRTISTGPFIPPHDG